MAPFWMQPPLKAGAVPALILFTDGACQWERSCPVGDARVTLQPPQGPSQAAGQAWWQGAVMPLVSCSAL